MLSYQPAPAPPHDLLAEGVRVYERGGALPYVVLGPPVDGVLLVRNPGGEVVSWVADRLYGLTRLESTDGDVIWRAP